MASINRVNRFGYIKDYCFSSWVKIKVKNGEKIAKGSTFISASWASLLRYQTCQISTVLITHTSMYITAIAPVLCIVVVFAKSSLFFLILRKQEIVFLRIFCAHGIRVGIASGLYFSSCFASDKSASPLQLLSLLLIIYFLMK